MDKAVVDKVLNSEPKVKSKTKQKGTKHKEGYHVLQHRTFDAKETSEEKTDSREAYGSRQLDPNRPAQKLLNVIANHKSFDSKDIKDEISKAIRCKTTGNMEKAVERLKLARDILEYAIKALTQEDKMEAVQYFKTVF
jgi:hypothetical protein